jgi:PKD repeat protein
MNRKVIFILLSISMFCPGIMLMLNISSDVSPAQVTEEPSVSITADVTSGTAPLEVSFTSAVNDPFAGEYPITYEWYFDDGAASTKENPQHTFTGQGEYTVLCRVTFWKSPRVTVQAGVNIEVIVVQPLAVSISANPTSGNAPLTVNFISTVTGGIVGEVFTYAWDFGDSTASEEPDPTHTFNTAGTYNVTCTVTGNTTSQTAQDTVEINVTQPAAVCTAPYNQLNPKITSDGSGGAVITWISYHSASGSYNIYARRINSAGELLWTADGVAVCTADHTQERAQITGDGTGGAIITWQDYRSGNNWHIYARRIDSTGTPQWTADGVAICTADNHQQNPYPQITPDGSGGVIVTWQDYRSGNNWNIYAQRIDSEGNVQWTANGAAICSAVNHQQYPQITGDGSGGAVITWRDFRSGMNHDIYAQRIDSEGNIQWTSDGVAICGAANNQNSPNITPDGSGGAVITWQDYRSGNNHDIYARRINGTGTPLWAADGVPICTADNLQQYPQIVSDGSGGAIITWQDDNRSGNGLDIYAQRIDSEGNTRWPPNGTAICTAANQQEYPQIISDGSGGAIITWQDYRSGNNRDIYAQRIDSEGNIQWTPNGAAVCTAVNYQQSPRIASDGSGGAIVTWEDYRSGNYDIYAQRITKDGVLK